MSGRVFAEGESWARIDRRYRYVLKGAIEMDLPVTVLPGRERLAELRQEWDVGTFAPPAWITIERRCSTGPGPPNPIDSIKIAAGYAWDGATKATDPAEFMRTSAVHDALYQMGREGLLPASARAAADEIMRKVAIMDGFPKWRAWTRWAAVRLFGGKCFAKVAS